MMRALPRTIKQKMNRLEKKEKGGAKKEFQAHTEVDCLSHTQRRDGTYGPGMYHYLHVRAHGDRTACIVILRSPPPYLQNNFEDIYDANHEVVELYWQIWEKNMTSMNYLDLSSQRIMLFLMQEDENARIVETQWRNGLYPHLLHGTDHDYRKISGTKELHAGARAKSM